MSETIKKLSFDMAWAIAGALIAAGTVYGVMRSDNDHLRRDVSMLQGQVAGLQQKSEVTAEKLAKIETNVEWIRSAMERRGIQP